MKSLKAIREATSSVKGFCSFKDMLRDLFFRIALNEKIKPRSNYEKSRLRGSFLFALIDTYSLIYLFTDQRKPIRHQSTIAESSDMTTSQTQCSVYLSLWGGCVRHC